MAFFNCSVAKLDTHFDSYFPHNPNKVKTMGNAKIGSRTYWVGGTLICSKGHLIEHVRGEKIGDLPPEQIVAGVQVLAAMMRAERSGLPEKVA